MYSLKRRLFIAQRVAPVLVVAVVCAQSWLLAAEKAERPNIVFMLADDQGWNGLSVAMHPNVPGSKGDYFHTPNLEKLAAQGMRFSAAYAPASVCSPTRASLLTGKSPAKLHWTKAAPPEEGHKLSEPRLIKSISTSETTFAEMLQKAGYATAHYGKWHISGGGPGQHGYDEHDGDTGNENAFKFKDPNPVDIFGMADRAATFMERNRSLFNYHGTLCTHRRMRTMLRLRSTRSFSRARIRSESQRQPSRRTSIQESARCWRPSSVLV